MLSVLLTIGIMCVSGMLLYLGAHPLMRLFSPVAEVVNLGAEMLRLVALSEPFFGFMEMYALSDFLIMVFVMVSEAVT